MACQWIWLSINQQDKFCSLAIAFPPDVQISTSNQTFLTLTEKGFTQIINEVTHI